MSLAISPVRFAVNDRKFLLVPRRRPRFPWTPGYFMFEEVQGTAFYLLGWFATETDARREAALWT